MLFAFVADRDVKCPVCRYNLRALTEPRCPECHHALRLSVGAQDFSVLRLVATVTPGLFSGIAALLLLIPFVLSSVSGNVPPWPAWALFSFGAASGIAALVVLRYRVSFLRHDRGGQLGWAIVAWAIHIGAFIVLMVVSLR